MIIRNQKSGVYNFFIGLHDKDETTQKFLDEEFETVLKGICENYHVGYSLYYVDGGYISDDGNYVKEKSIVMKIFDISLAVADKIGSDICFFFNQECIRVTYEPIEIIDIKG